MDGVDRIAVRLDSSSPRAELRWTFAAHAQATHVLRWDDLSQPIRLHAANGGSREWASATDALNWLEASVREPLFQNGRWIGFLSYDLGRIFEDLPAQSADDFRLPLLIFSFHSNVGRALPATSDGGGQCPPCISSSERARIFSTLSRQEYLRSVDRAMEFIAAGDIFQVNLSHRITVPQRADVRSIYHRLLEATPARYGACLDYGDFALICNSPELFLRVRTDSETGRRRVMTRPIKGTRPAGAGMEAELRNSLKDQAELNMIVDLERNDLGRVCEIGSVHVTEPRAIEAHPTIFQGVATIEGTLRSDVSLADLLRATFPGGSVTGAPKIRAMQIIEELEPVRRGPYCGAIGYLAPDGLMEFNVAIRTMIVKDGRVHIPVGGGIVADSDPANEYEETLIKARAMLTAVGVRIADLDQVKSSR